MFESFKLILARCQGSGSMLPDYRHLTHAFLKEIIMLRAMAFLKVSSRAFLSERNSCGPVFVTMFVIVLYILRSGCA